MALVMLQVAGSLTLLVGGGLTTRSLLNMVQTDFGVKTEGLVRVSIDFPSSADPDPSATAARYERLTGALATLAGRPVPLFQWPQFAETPSSRSKWMAPGSAPPRWRCSPSATATSRR